MSRKHDNVVTIPARRVGRSYQAAMAGAKFVQEIELPSPTELRRAHDELDTLLRSEPSVPYSVTNMGERYVDLAKENARLKAIIVRYAKGSHQQHELNVELMAVCQRQADKLKKLGVRDGE